MRFSLSSGVTVLVSVCLAGPVFAAHDSSVCGTNRETNREAIFLHRQSLRARAALGMRSLAATAASTNRDVGNVAIIEDRDGVVARQNQFNLDNKTLRFIPSAPNAAKYQFGVSDAGYDGAAASAGTLLAGLGDDDTRPVAIPFSFPFFNAAYRQVFVNSDGNLTFTAGDNTSSDRSLGRLAAGSPRISPLFDDLDPSRAGAVRVTAEPGRLVVSWVGVPEYQQSGTGPVQTFQVRLYPDGRIEFAYSGISASGAVTGIAPGNLQGSVALVSFRNDASGDYDSGVAERFGDTLSIDVVTVAQKFYQTHEDAYDYLVIYNAMDISAGSTAVAYENTVRSTRTGIGDGPADSGKEYGSAARLQAVLNLGRLSQYPRDPNGIVEARRAAGDTPLTIIGHESGHLFLAYASIRDPNDPEARPMLGAQMAHWSFVFNSEASLLEGERIQDLGAGVSPRFLTTDTAQGYSPLDQYLMGFRAAEEVPPTFLGTGVLPFLPLLHPIRNFRFDGGRQDIAVNDVIAAEGRRTPDYTVAQRRFRFAFILVVAKDAQPTADQLTQVETYRQQFEPFYSAAASNRATADATLKKSLQLSLFPAAGVLAGAAGAATLTVESAPASDLTVQFQTLNGAAGFPASVNIPAGSTHAAFSFNGIKAGVEEVTAVPTDTAYETAVARVQVADASAVRMEAVSGDRQVPDAKGALADPVVILVTDVNRLPYPAVRVAALASAGGAVIPATAITDAQGRASFVWTPGTGAVSQLKLTLEGAPASLTVSAGTSVPVAQAVVNAASFTGGLSPGSLATVTGVNLAGGNTAQAGYPWPDQLGGTTVTLNGRTLPLLFVSDRQINFYLPPDVPTGHATLTASSASGAASVPAILSAASPGVFFDAATGYGAVLIANTGVSTVTRPAAPGDYLEIYCTGLGPVGAAKTTLLTPSVYIGGTPATVTYSGLAPGYVGLYQINAAVPSGIPSGPQTLTVAVPGSQSNDVRIRIQ